VADVGTGAETPGRGAVVESLMLRASRALHIFGRGDAVVNGERTFLGDGA